MGTIRWFATLSDGTEALEETGEWRIVPGERKPWVRLCDYAASHNLTVTSLAIQTPESFVNLPVASGRFGLDAKAPLCYSVQYIAEAELSNVLSQANFIDFTAHYDEFEVHYILDADSGEQAWMAVTYGTKPLMPSPLTNP